MSDLSSYDRLVRLIREAGVLESVEHLLYWDQETMMPSGGCEIREQQMEVIASLRHRILTDPRIGELLGKIDCHMLSDEQAAQVREIERMYTRLVRVPAELVKREFGCIAKAGQILKVAMSNNDFALLAPSLEEIIAVNREEALCINPDSNPYLTLVEENHPGITLNELDTFFSETMEALAPLIKEIAITPAVDTSILNRNIRASTQMTYVCRILKATGYDFTKGRLDRASHSFCVEYGRLTVRVSTWTGTIQLGLHEAGHGRYQQGLPLAHFGTPLGDACSMTVHESLAMLWQGVIGTSHAFWAGQYQGLQLAYEPALDGIDLDRLYRLINAIKPTYDGGAYDELRWPLHHALRTNMERQLIEGTLAVKDLPEAWNEEEKRLFGPVPSTKDEVLMRYSHMAFGYMAYSPIYALGSAYASQIWEAMDHSIPNLSTKIEKGDFAELNQWLTENIYRHGRCYNTTELITRATGEAPSAKAYIRYLTKKYRELYQL